MFHTDRIEYPTYEALAGAPALPHSGIAKQPHQRLPLAGAPAIPRRGIAKQPRQRLPAGLDPRPALDRGVGRARTTW